MTILAMWADYNRAIKHPVHAVAKERATLILNCDIIVHSLITKFRVACCCEVPGGGVNVDGYAPGGLAATLLPTQLKYNCHPCVNA